MEYNNTNRGQIWKNEDRKSDSHPHFKGSMDIDGVEYWVSAWTRKPDANPKSPALTFSFKKKIKNFVNSYRNKYCLRAYLVLNSKNILDGFLEEKKR